MAYIKKDERRNENIPPSSSSSTSTAASIQRQDEQQHAQVNRAIDQTKENIRASIDEARKEISQYAQSVTDYHQQAMDSAQEITDNYLDSQREIINSTQQTWTNYLDTVYWWISPRKLSEIYTRAVSNFADNSVSASKIWNETAMATMDASKAYLVRTKEASRDLSRINGNTARTIGRTSSQMRSGSSRSS